MPLSSFDVYPKTLKEFRQRTVSGALVSVGCMALIGILSAIEVSDLLTTTLVDHLFVDTTRGQRLDIHINISFPALPCSVVTLDTLDMSGNHADDLMRNISKTRLDATGAALDTPAAPASRHLLAVQGPQMLPAGALLQLTRSDALLSQLLAHLLPNVFEDKEAIAELRKHVGEGCRLEGTVTVNRVAGNFHFAMSEADHHTLMSVFRDRESLNVSHHIHSIAFGDSYPGLVNPLDGVAKDLSTGSGYFQYYIKMVPTVYEALDGAQTHTNQYSYTELFRTTKETEKMPAVYFHYEISPIMAKFVQSRRPLGHFLTTFCAIVGGVFTVAGLLDSCIHRMSKWSKSS